MPQFTNLPTGMMTMTAIYLAESLVRARKPHQTRVCILEDGNLSFMVPKILLARMTQVLKMAPGWASALYYKALAQLRCSKTPCITMPFGFVDPGSLVLARL